MHSEPSDAPFMERALQLAARGEGHVEPNPMVGAVVVREGRIVGEGWHQRFGGPHAEVEALQAAGELARSSTLYVTLEPCCHQGKTPPCTEAILAAGVRRVVAALADPFSQVAGQGFQKLRAAGVEAEVGLLATEATSLVTPYLMLVREGRPWVIAKWAMSLDGKIATREGESRWISSPSSREVVHQIRGRVDAILVGRGTAAADDPLLTARPPGPRTATRIVLDSRASLALDSQLARTAGETPLLVAAGSDAPREAVARLEAADAEVLLLDGASHAKRLEQLLAELGKRQMTNLLVEGGAGVLGAFNDGDLIDELHVFIAPLVLGAEPSPSPVAGVGLASMADVRRLHAVQISQIEQDVYIRGRVRSFSPSGIAPEQE